MSALSDNSSDGMPANLQNADLQNGNRRSGEYSSDGYPASATDRASQTSPLRQQIRSNPLSRFGSLKIAAPKSR